MADVCREEKMPTKAQQTILDTERRVLELMHKMYEDRLLDLDMLLRQAINLRRLEQEFGGLQSQ